MANAHFFEGAPDSVVLLSRWLLAQNAPGLASARRLAYAARALEIARADVALALLDGIANADIDAAALLLRARVCIAALRLGEAQAALQACAARYGIDAEHAALAFAAARAGGTWIPADLDATAFAAAFAGATPAPRAGLRAATPFARLPFAFAARTVAALAGAEISAALRFAMRWLAAQLLQVASRLAVGVAVRWLQLRHPGRAIHFTAMGKFTRLADLVDRLDPILRRLEADGGADRHRLYVFFFGGYPNATLFELVGRSCRIVAATTRVRRKLAYLALAALRRADSLIEATTDYRVIGQSMRDNPAVLRFEAREAEELRARLEAMGIDPAKRFILFGLRDMAYYRFYGDVMAVPLEKQGRRAATHHRCPPLETYAAAANAWAQAGHQVLRMGLRVSEALPGGLDPKVIDYANGARDDALDAYLFAHCWFMIAGDTGLFSGAAAFDRPSVLSDLYLIQNTMYSSNKRTPNIYVPKLYRRVEDGTKLSFRETVYLNHAFATHEACIAAGVEVVNNDADDILAASQELVARLEGRFELSAEDDARQQAFRALYQPGHIGYGSTALASAAFLRKHAALLDAAIR